MESHITSEYVSWLEEQIKELSKLIYKWHPFPKEKPNSDDDYLITVGNWNVQIGVYNSATDAFEVRYGNGNITGVTAWAELPKPYEGE